MALKFYEDKPWLWERYVVQGKTPEEIAAECGVSHMTIRRWLRKFGIA